MPEAWEIPKDIAVGVLMTKKYKASFLLQIIILFSLMPSSDDITMPMPLFHQCNYDMAVVVRQHALDFHFREFIMSRTIWVDCNFKYFHGHMPLSQITSINNAIKHRWWDEEYDYIYFHGLHFKFFSSSSGLNIIYRFSNADSRHFLCGTSYAIFSCFRLPQEHFRHSLSPISGFRRFLFTHTIHAFSAPAIRAEKIFNYFIIQDDTYNDIAHAISLNIRKHISELIPPRLSSPNLWHDVFHNAHFTTEYIFRYIYDWYIDILTKSFDIFWWISIL